MGNRVRSITAHRAPGLSGAADEILLKDVLARAIPRFVSSRRTTNRRLVRYDDAILRRGSGPSMRQVGRAVSETTVVGRSPIIPGGSRRRNRDRACDAPSNREAKAGTARGGYAP